MTILWIFVAVVFILAIIALITIYYTVGYDYKNGRKGFLYKFAWKISEWITGGKRK